MKNSILAIIIVFVIANYSYSQVNQEWVEKYDGPGGSSDDYARFIAVDGSGNIYVTGESTGTGTSYDYATIKYNSSGNSLWVARYNGPGNFTDQVSSAAVDNSGNVYVTGESYGSGTDADYATIKYNSSGDSLWVARYNGPGNSRDVPNSIAVDDSGNVYVTGYSIESGISFDYATIKYNSSGVLQWIQRYNVPGNKFNAPTSLAVDCFSNVYVTGQSDGSGTDADYATIKYNSSGDSLWVRRYNGPGNFKDVPYSIAVDDSENVYITGSSYGSGTNEDYATIKYNSSGDQQWVQRYNGPGNGWEVPKSIAIDGSGNVYVTGTDFNTVKYNSTGDQQWVQMYSGYRASSLAVDGSGNVYVTGYRRISDGYTTIKYNTFGVQQWFQSYKGTGFASAQSIAVDGLGNVYVTGSSSVEPIEGNSDYTTIKYSQSVGITQINNSVPEKFSLSQNYPNPFNPATKINYEIRITNFVSLKVYDVLGNEVFVLVNEKQNAGSYEVDFDGRNLTSGVYFYKLQTDDFSETKKMTLLK